jgi:hypothetical protein
VNRNSHFKAIAVPQVIDTTNSRKKRPENHPPWRGGRGGYAESGFRLDPRYRPAAGFVSTKPAAAHEREFHVKLVDPVHQLQIASRDWTRLVVDAAPVDPQHDRLAADAQLRL